MINGEYYGKINIVVNNAQASKSGVMLKDHTKEDFDYFMIDALKSNYYLAKKHSKALVLLKNGKINEKIIFSLPVTHK